MAAVRRKILAASVVFLTALALAGVLHRPKDLLNSATRISVADGLITSERIFAGYHHRYHHVPAYAWLSDTTLVSLGNTAAVNRELVQLDLGRGNVAGGQRLGQSEGNPLDGSFYWAFSPVGRRVLSLSESGQSVACVVWTVDGRRQRAWTNRIDGSFEPTWLADGSGFILWYGLVGIIRARLLEVESGAVHEFRLDRSKVAVMESPARLSPRRAAIPSALWTSDSAPEFLEIAGGEGGLTATRRQVRLPEELRSTGAKVFVSPEGDRLAWLATFEWRIPNLKSSPTFPFLSAERRSTYRVFISAPDGSGLRPLDPFRGEEEIGEVVWTPAGQHLSFVRANALWTVPVGQPRPGGLESK